MKDCIVSSIFVLFIVNVYTVKLWWLEVAGTIKISLKYQQFDLSQTSCI